MQSTLNIPPFFWLKMPLALFSLSNPKMYGTIPTVSCYPFEQFGLFQKSVNQKYLFPTLRCKPVSLGPNWADDEHPYMQEPPIDISLDCGFYSGLGHFSFHEKMMKCYHHLCIHSGLPIKSVFAIISLFFSFLSSHSWHQQLLG